MNGGHVVEIIPPMSLVPLLEGFALKHIFSPRIHSAMYYGRVWLRMANAGVRAVPQFM